MPRDQTDHTGRFMRAIAAFSAAPDEIHKLGRKLRHSAEDDETGALAIAREVAETVLRRKLTFRSAPDKELVLEVMERRVLRVVQNDEVGSEDTNSSALEAGDATYLAQMVEKFTSSDEAIYVVSDLVEGTNADPIAGVSATDLYLAICEKTEPQSPLAQAISASKPVTRAVLQIEEETERALWGNASECDELRHVALAVRRSLKPPSSLSVWSDGLADNTAVIVVCVQGSSVLALTTSDKIPELVAIWHPLIADDASG